MSKKIYLNKKSGLRYIEISGSELSRNGKQLTVVSLFTGAGGLDIGLEEAGFETVVCIENDADCRATIKHNRPEWKVFEASSKKVKGKIINRQPGDIRDIEVEEALKFANLKKGNVSLVVGGAPCQPFSNLGNQEGRNDKKNGDLFLEFVRFVKGVEPKAFIFENVAGITQQKHSEVIEYMLEKFSGQGYGLSYTILNAANYGVPQKRERFFLIGIKGVENPAFPFPTHFKNDPKLWDAFIADLEPVPSKKPKNWVTVKDAFSMLPTEIEQRNDFALMNISDVVKERMKYIRQGENFKALPMEMRPNCWRGGKHQGQDTFGRLVEDLPAVTIRTAAYNPSKGMYIHPNEDRGLNTLEMAALQSFPTNWEFRCEGKDKITLVSGGKQIGNAVPPGLASALGKAIKQQITSKQSSKSVQKLHTPAEVN